LGRNCGATPASTPATANQAKLRAPCARVKATIAARKMTVQTASDDSVEA